MRDPLVVDLLLLAIVGLLVLRVVVRIWAVRRARSRPRPDHLNPAVPVLFAVIVAGAFAVELRSTPSTGVGALTAIAATSLTAALAGSFFENRDLRARASDSWDAHRITADGVVGLVLLVITVAGVVLMRLPGGQAHGLWWLDPVGTAIVLLLGNAVAWAWRRAHPARVTH